MTFDHDPRIVSQLELHGIRLTASTRPELAREQLNDLYRYEIRTLRRRLRADAFPRVEYVDRVIALRKRYWLLSVPVENWNRQV